MHQEVRVIEKNSQTVLMTFALTSGNSMDQLAKAYEFAHDMENLGVDVMVETPSIHDSLATSLGVDQKEREEYQQSLVDELDSHESEEGCCGS